jgi:xanthine dehydrogenase accessory factor
VLDTGETQMKEALLYAAVVGSEFNIAVFGAGHVGSAVVRTLSALDCNIRWIDSRRNIFRATPANVRAIEAEAPQLEVAAMPPASCYLVMTHSHPLDLEICERILRRGDAVYCGLIGSLTKRRRFEKRLREFGLPQSAIDKLVCPIGVEGITGKKPAEIAIAASADLLRAWEASRAATRDLPGNVQPIRG